MKSGYSTSTSSVDPLVLEMVQRMTDSDEMQIFDSVIPLDLDMLTDQIMMQN